jgi:uncharacterized OsmC-like protein
MYKASIENHGGSKHHATTRHATFLMDTEGQAANPVDAFLASLCACLGHFVRDFLDRENLTSNGFSIEAQADVTPDKKLLAEIHVAIDVQDANLNSDQKSALLGYVEQCKIHRILVQVPGIRLTLSGKG